MAVGMLLFGAMVDDKGDLIDNPPERKFPGDYRSVKNSEVAGRLFPTACSPR